MILRGSQIFNNGSCHNCHSLAGQHTTERGPNLSDVEWLHSDGEFEGIQSTIFWGVPEDRMKAVTPRPFQMNPSGGMPLVLGEREDLAAYVWSLSRSDRSPFIVDQARFIALAREGVVEEAIALFRESTAAHGNHHLLPENGLNRLAYEVLESLGPAPAIELFTLNTELHPEAWNPWDSLAEAHMLNGDRDLAIRYYERSLELNPDNQNAAQKLRELRGDPTTWPLEPHRGTGGKGDSR